MMRYENGECATLSFPLHDHHHLPEAVAKFIADALAGTKA
jgi:hypothetical protein